MKACGSSSVAAATNSPKSSRASRVKLAVADIRQTPRNANLAKVYQPQSALPTSPFRHAGECRHSRLAENQIT
jgi:hypothetical protein